MYGDLPELKLEGSDDTVAAFPILIESSPTGPKTAAVRLPTTDEMFAYLLVQRSILRDLGRRQSDSEEVLNPKADLKLFDSIRLDRGDSSKPFDAAEAARAIGMVTRHRVTDCSRDGEGYRITLSTLFGPTTHEVRIPYEAEKAEYTRTFMKERDLPYGVAERRFPPDPYIKLYDLIIQSVSGYSDQHNTPAKVVPPHHKRSVVNELLVTLNALDPDLDPNS